MKITYKYLIALLIPLFMISSCSFQMTKTVFEDIMNIRIGMDKASALEIIDDDDGFYIINDFEKDIFDISKKISSDKAKYEILIAKRFRSTNPEFYIFAFKDNKVLYWGYPNEFARENNKVFEEIAVAGIEIIKNDYIEHFID